VNWKEDLEGLLGVNDGNEKALVDTKIGKKEDSPNFLSLVVSGKSTNKRLHLIGSKATKEDQNIAKHREYHLCLY